MDTIVIVLSVIFGIAVIAMASYLTYLIRIRLQWNFILREAALASTKALQTYAKSLAEQKGKSSTDESEAIRERISSLFRE